LRSLMNARTEMDCVADILKLLLRMKRVQPESIDQNECAMPTPNPVNVIPVT